MVAEPLRSVFVLDPIVDVPRRSLRCPGAVITGRRLLYTRFRQGGVNGHRPYGLFTRAIPAELSAPEAIWAGNWRAGCRSAR